VRNLEFGPSPAPVRIGAASPCQGEAKKKIRGPSTSFGMTQKSEPAGFCDALAEPSPTGRQAAGRHSRENNGRGRSRIRAVSAAGCL